MSKRTITEADRQEARFQYLKTSDVAETLDCSRAHVVEMVKGGAFPDLPDGTAAVVDIGVGNRPEYRIHPDSFALYQRGDQAA